MVNIKVCLVHSLHLAVIEVLHKTKAYIQASGPNETNNDSFEEVTYDDDLITAEEENLDIQEDEL